MNWIEKEIEQALADGVSHPDNLPFLLTPEKSNGQAVVLIHGFGATPRSILPVATALHRDCYTVAGVRLPGHGTTPQDLKERTADAWLAATLAAYEALAATGARVSVGGLSTGALVALKLAAAHPVHKLLLFSPFLRLRHRLAPFAGPLSLFVAYKKQWIPPEMRDFYYQQRPLKAVAQINRLLRDMPQVLPRINAPTLILCSRGDSTIAAGTVVDLYQRLGTPNKIMHTYGDDVPHVITTAENPQLEDVLERCCEFMQRDFSQGG